MTIYGSGGGRLSAPRKLSTPKHSAGRRSDLSIRKGTGSKIIQFRRFNTGGNEDVGIDEFISGINYHSHGQAKERATEDRPKIIDDAPLHAFIHRAYTSCSTCHEPIAGNSPRNVVISVTLPNVGAEASACVIKTVCEACSGLVQEKPPEQIAANGWKRLLSPRQLEIWNRAKENNEKQSVVAESLRMHQGQVSKVLAACAKIRDAYMPRNITE